MRIILSFLISLLFYESFSQELFCNLQVNSSQIQTSDRRVFNSLQKDLYEFINNTKWTNAKFSNEERIECSILINVRKKISNDEYEGSINIQSTRPIYGTSYKSNVFNFVDNNFRFKYLEYQSIDYNPNTHGSNLTAVMAFYVNIILGIDFATYSENGGYQYFNNALKIVNNAQNAPESGWKAFESDRNRYWLAYDLMDSRYANYLTAMYSYHRLGMDKLSEEPEDARFEITESLESLKSIYRENPSAFLLKIFFDAKNEEIIKIYSESFPNEKARIVNTLVEIDPTNSSKYQTITIENKGN